MKRLGKIKTLALVSLSAIALVGPVVLAQNAGKAQDGQGPARAEWRGQGKHFGHGGGPMGGAMFRDLNLTEDQKTRMQQINQSFRERTQSLRQQLQAKRQELRQASEGDTFNEALATQKLQEAASLEAKLMGEHFKLRQEMLSVLTPEQKTQLEQKRAEFKAKRSERRGPKIQ